VGLARTVARDVGRYGVTCNAVSAQADTRLFTASADAWQQGRNRIDPQEVAGLPPPAFGAWAQGGGAWDAGNVAPLIAFLCTDTSANINGQVLGARGGDVYLYSNPAIERSIHTWGRRFTLDELEVLGPRNLGYAVTHPAPVQA
jgi:3-oxoacyl-[acyl-carrier protein] reductase